MTKSFDASKIWRIRSLAVEHSGPDLWVVKKLVVGSRRQKGGDSPTYVTLPRVEALFLEATGKLAGREERQLLSLSIDLAAERPTVVAGYLMRSEDPRQELIALTAELEALAKDDKSQFTSVRALEAPEKEDRREGIVRRVELELRQPPAGEKDAHPDPKPKR